MNKLITTILFILISSVITIAQINGFLLHDAIYDTNRVVVDSLLKLGVDPDYQAYDGTTPLIVAAEQNDSLTVAKLLQYDADVNKLDWYGTSPLIAAASNDNWNICEMLIRKGAKINYASDCGTALFHASTFNAYNTTDLLIYYGADIEKVSSDSITPLMIASYYNNFEIVDLLLHYGASIEEKNLSGKSALDLAVENNSIEAVRILIENGAKYSIKNNSLKSPLQIAVINQSNEMTGLLLNYTDLSKEHKILSDYAWINEDHDLVKHLKNNGMKTNGLLFWRLSLMFDEQFSNDGYFLGGSVGIQELKTKSSFIFGIQTRLKTKWIIYQYEPHIYYQFHEKRSFAFLAFEKQLASLSIGKTSLKPFLGIRSLYSWGSVQGTRRDVENKYYYSPQLGFNWHLVNFDKSSSLGIKFSYEYLEYDFPNSAESKWNLSVILADFLLKKNRYKKSIMPCF